MLNPKYLGQNPTIQCNSKVPVDFTVGKIRPLVKGIFYNAAVSYFALEIVNPVCKKKKPSKTFLPLIV